MTIGIFDSGIGGISVLKEIKKKFSNSNFIYFGDTKRIPYGNKDKKEIINLSFKITSFLENKKVDIIIIACNTTSAIALDILKKKIKTPIIGILKAGVKAAVKFTKKGGRIAVLGTEATIKSDCYNKLIKKYKYKIKVLSIACPELVNFIEKGDISSNNLTNILKKYLLNCLNCDTLILGCTHYPFLIKIIKKLIKFNIKIIDPAKYLIEDIENELKNNLFKNSSEKKIEDICYVSGEKNKFNKNLKIFFSEHDFKSINIYDPVEDL